ncbi:putative glutamate carboxypeptidase AMP1 [Bienertia sinuspersici]
MPVFNVISLLSNVTYSLCQMQNLRADGASSDLEVYGPSSNYKSEIGFFPSIVNAISLSTQTKRETQATIQHEIWRVARAIQRVADALKGDLN